MARQQVIGKSREGETVYIEWGTKSASGGWYWRVCQQDPAGWADMCPYHGEADDEHEAIDAAKTAAIEDPQGYIRLR